MDSVKDSMGSQFVLLAKDWDRGEGVGGRKNQRPTGLIYSGRRRCQSDESPTLVAGPV